MRREQTARGLRNQQTDEERLLWRHLRAKRFGGAYFRRQHPIGPFVVDFVCLDCHLIIELDGSQHADSVAYDRRRSDYLRERGFRVLRFWNSEVHDDLSAVLSVIWNELGK